VSAAVLIGLLGCGPSAIRLYLPAARRLGSVRITAAYDPVPARREAAARLSPGCRPVATAEALFESRVVDAVIVAGDLASRAGLAVQALGARLPVLMDTPPASTIADALWLAEAERIARVPLMIGLNRRWWEPAERIRRALAEGAEPEAIAATSIMVRGPSSGRPEGSAESDTELFEDLGTQIDLIRHVLDREIAVVSARRDPVEQVEVRLALLGGGSATCRAGRGPRSEDRLTVVAGRRSYQLRAGSDRARPSGGTSRAALDLADSTRRRLTAGRDSLARSYDRLLERFVAAVRSRTATPPGIGAAMAVMLAVEAARRSLAGGAVEVEVPPVPV
jgi:predicted dehydrogenase